MVGSMRIKPDILAPGGKIIAPRAAGTIMGTIFAGNDMYTVASGTSMATPHVAGVAALVKQVHVDWNSTTLKSALMQTADPLGYTCYEEGLGLVNASRAAEASVASNVSTATVGGYWVTEGIYRVNILVTNLDVVQNHLVVSTSVLKDDEVYSTSAIGLDATDFTLAAGSGKKLVLQVNASGIAFGNYQVKVAITSDLDDFPYHALFVFARVCTVNMHLLDGGIAFSNTGLGGYRFGIYKEDFSLSKMGNFNNRPGFDSFYLYPGTYVAYAIGFYQNLMFFIETDVVLVEGVNAVDIDLATGIAHEFQLETEDEPLSLVYGSFIIYDYIASPDEIWFGDGFLTGVEIYGNIFPRDNKNLGWGSKISYSGNSTFISTPFTHQMTFTVTAIPESESGLVPGDQFECDRTWSGLVAPDDMWVSTFPCPNALESVENMYFLGWKLNETLCNLTVPNNFVMVENSSWTLENTYGNSKPWPYQGGDNYIVGGSLQQKPLESRTWDNGFAPLWAAPEVLPIGHYLINYFIPPNRDMTFHFGTTGERWWMQLSLDHGPNWMYANESFVGRVIQGDVYTNKSLDLSRNYYLPAQFQFSQAMDD
nr:S8 family serine peptidase [Candidatus Sigynarchaeota archaeon]